MSSDEKSTTIEHFTISNNESNSMQENSEETIETDLRINNITTSFTSLGSCACIPVCPPTCPTGPTGATGATGSIGATGATTQIRGLEIQLQGEAISVASASPVMFDTIVNSLATFISYNPLTSIVTITDTGVFYIHWWVSTDGMEGGIDIVPTFAIITSLGQTIKASSPIMTGQVSGNALISVVASLINPLTLQLINVTDSTIGFGTTPVKADLTIFYVTF